MILKTPVRTATKSSGRPTKLIAKRKQKSPD
jgi:hypothetical protein